MLAPIRPPSTFWLSILALCALGCAGVPASPETAPTDAFVGTWIVDLRPTPDAEPYFQEFVVESVEGGQFLGSFYGTSVENARLNADWGPLHFAFTTDDGSGTYHTTGTLEGGVLYGTTHALGRGFLAVWTAEREE